MRLMLRTMAYGLLLPAAVIVAGASVAQNKPPRPASPAPPAPAAASPAATGSTAAAGATADTAAGDVIAQAGAVKITAGDVRALLEQLGSREQAAFSRDPRLLSQAVRSMLANQLVLEQALSKKWDQQPAVAAQLERVRRDAIIESYLRAATAPPPGFPTDKEVEAVYEANKPAFLVPRQFRLAQITVNLAQGSDKKTEDEARKKLDDILAKLKAPQADFAAVATAVSDDRDSAAKGGDLGWLAENQIRPEIRAQVIGLPKGATGEPVQLDDGWHILKLLDTTAAYTRPLSDVRDQLTQRLRDERALANRRAFLAKLAEQTPPAINELALSKIVEEVDHKASSK